MTNATLDTGALEAPLNTIANILTESIGANGWLKGALQSIHATNKSIIGCLSTVVEDLVEDFDAAVIHEFIRRSDRFRLAKARKKHHCTLVSAHKRFDGEISVKVVAVIAVKAGSLQLDDAERVGVINRVRQVIRANGFMGRDAFRSVKVNKGLQ